MSLFESLTSFSNDKNGQFCEVIYQTQVIKTNG